MLCFRFYVTVEVNAIHFFNFVERRLIEMKLEPRLVFLPNENENPIRKQSRN